MLMDIGCRTSPQLDQGKWQTQSAPLGSGRPECDLKVHFQAEFDARKRGEPAPESMTHVQGLLLHPRTVWLISRGEMCQKDSPAFLSLF